MAKTKGLKKIKPRSTAIEHVYGSNFALQNRKKFQKTRIKRVCWRDEIEGVGVSNMSEFADPAILSVKKVVRYTKDQLMDLRESPLSQRKPDFLDPAEVTPSILDPERWNLERKKSDTPTENGSKPGDATDHRRRPGDARERIRKENDGIVLSPQRRSFNSGCFVPVREPTTTTRTNRPHSPLGKNENTHIGVREIQPASRRIGSGRILRDWDFDGKADAEGSEYGAFRRQNSAPDSDNKYGSGSSDNRRSFGRDYDKDKETRRGGGRYDRRRMDSGRDEEPEWFSGGPLSQNDTIELRGFDEPEKPTAKKKLSPSRAKRAKEWSKKKNDLPSQQQTVPEEKEEATSNHQTDVASKEIGKHGKQGSGGKEAAIGGGDFGDVSDEKENKKYKDDTSFNLDEILKADNLSTLLTNGVGDADAGKSRFSRWFQRDSPDKEQQLQQQRSRMHPPDENSIVKDILGEIGEPNVSIPGDAESYFAPISPAGGINHLLHQAGKKHVQQPNKNINSIIELLQRGHTPDNANIKHMQNNMMKLDELEAKMRQSADMQQKPIQKPEEDLTAFKRLLAQVSGGHAIPVAKAQQQQPMSLLEMLNHSQQQDEARLHMMGGGGPTSPNVSFGAGGDMTSFKQLQIAAAAAAAHKQQQQMELLNKIINAQPSSHQLRASPIHDLGLQQSRELLNRPEAQAILQGLHRGDITPQHLYQQLGNPAMQTRHREMLLTILKQFGGGPGGGGGGVGPSPRVLSPVPPLNMFAAQQQQQLRVSPMTPSALHQRIPSPRELQIHTQNILQKALIKKKLEEQTENYRKKQEQQQQQARGQSPNPATTSAGKSVSSPTPLAFTPTSVLRKMTADKDEGGKENRDAKPQGRPLTGMRQQQQLSSSQMPQQPQWGGAQQSFGGAGMSKQPGRPIVKANSNYQQHQASMAAEQFFAQQQQRHYGQQQQRKTHQQQQQYMNNQNNNPQQQSQTGLPPSLHAHAYSSGTTANHQFANQLTQQQLRAQHQQHARPSTAAGQPQQQVPPGSGSHHQQGSSTTQMGYQQQSSAASSAVSSSSSGATATWQQILSSAQNNRNGLMGATGRGNADGGGDLSPSTTNQLARWFSPDLLERARGGELPSTAGLAQHALSLEEIERQTAPPVHN